MKNRLRFVLAAGLVLTAAGITSGAEPTAFDLIKEGNRYVGEQCRDKVVQIRSRKSIGTLTPAIWYIVYFDPDATLKAIEVKLGSGKKLDVTRPLRLLEPITGGDKVLDRTKFKVDSDEAIKIATSEPLLKPLTVKATQLSLEAGDKGPVWKVRLWAAKTKKPNEQAKIGEVFISADKGEILRRDLHINRVD
jgi:hypothetical protein